MEEEAAAPEEVGPPTCHTLCHVVTLTADSWVLLCMAHPSFTVSAIIWTKFVFEIILRLKRGFCSDIVQMFANTVASITY